MGPSLPAVFTVTVTVSPSYGQSLPHGSATRCGLYAPASTCLAAIPLSTPTSPPFAAHHHRRPRRETRRGSETRSEDILRGTCLTSCASPGQLTTWLSVRAACPVGYLLSCRDNPPRYATSDSFSASAPGRPSWMMPLRARITPRVSPLCQMLRPKTTPAAPAPTASWGTRSVSSRVSILGPPAIRTGTGQLSVTRRKSSV